jgi:hypothetical protein
MPQLDFPSLLNMIRFSFFMFVTHLPSQIILFRVKDESISFSQRISTKNLTYTKKCKRKGEESLESTRVEYMCRLKDLCGST